MSTGLRLVWTQTSQDAPNICRTTPDVNGKPYRSGLYREGTDPAEPWMLGEKLSQASQTTPGTLTPRTLNVGWIYGQAGCATVLVVGLPSKIGCNTPKIFHFRKGGAHAVREEA